MNVKLRKVLDEHAQSLTPDKEYVVLGIEADSYRIVCDAGEPYLYEPGNFEVVDATRPDFWVSKLGKEGELYAYPAAWFENYFFERYFDNEPGTAEAFWEECERLYRISRDA